MTTEQRQAATVSRREDAPECQACRTAEQAGRALLIEAMDRSVPHGTFNWRGICNTHTWQLAGEAEVLRSIIAARLQDATQGIDVDGPTGTRRFGRRGSRIASPNRGDCPFCAAMAAAAERALEPASVIPACLCLPHLCTALGSTNSRERIQALTAMALTQFNALEADLSELIRKSDYRFRDEPRGREATAWRRAAQLLAGAPAVRWSLRRAPDVEG